MKGRQIIGDMLVKLQRSERPEEDICGNALPKMQIQGDMAIIPISGVLMLNVPDWIKAYGWNLTDPNDIEQELDMALNDPRVTQIWQVIDSPGGESVAGQKLFDIFDAARRKKPIFSFTKDGGMVDSAAYNSAAASLAVYFGRYADVGCVGTYLVQLDDSKYWAELGIDWKVFRSGEFKGIGIDAITKEQEDYLQETVDQFGALFRRNVLKYRSMIDPANLRGQSFRGIEAAQLGFGASAVKDFDAAVAKGRKLLAA